MHGCDKKFLSSKARCADAGASILRRGPHYFFTFLSPYVSLERNRSTRGGGQGRCLFSGWELDWSAGDLSWGGLHNTAPVISLSGFHWPTFWSRVALDIHYTVPTLEDSFSNLQFSMTFRKKLNWFQRPQKSLHVQGEDYLTTVFSPSINLPGR